MNIPIPIIIIVITGIISIATGFLMFLYKSVETLKTGFTKIEELLIKSQLTDEFEGKECITRHLYISNKLKKHEDAIADHEKRLNKLDNK